MEEIEAGDALLRKCHLLSQVRKLLGLDINASRRLSPKFPEDKTLTANQIHFVNSIIDFFINSGRLDAKKLFQEQPFTGLHQGGIVGMFPDQKHTTANHESGSVDQ